MKKLLIILTIFITGCTVQTAPMINDSIIEEWCDESIISFSMLRLTGNLTVNLENIDMKGVNVEMCCINSPVSESGDYSKFCTTNPEDYNTTMWLYSEAKQFGEYMKSYTYNNETHGCVELHNTTSIMSIDCYALS